VAGAQPHAPQRSTTQLYFGEGKGWEERVRRGKRGKGMGTAGRREGMGKGRARFHTVTVVFPL